jgi:hypothetical protein
MTIFPFHFGWRRSLSVLFKLLGYDSVVFLEDAPEYDRPRETVAAGRAGR